MRPLPLRSIRTYTLFPVTTLCRSDDALGRHGIVIERIARMHGAARLTGADGLATAGAEIQRVLDRPVAMAETPALLGLGIGEGGIDTRRRGIVDALDGEIGMGDAMCCRRCHLLVHGVFPSSDRKSTRLNSSH